MDTGGHKKGREGFALVLIILIIAALGAMAVGTAIVTSKIKTTVGERRAVDRMRAIEKATRKYYRGHEAMGSSWSRDDISARVPTGDLGLGADHANDAWGRPYIFYVPSTSTQGNGLAGVTVQGSNAAGFILSTGANQDLESSVDTANPRVLSLGGDDFVRAVNVQDLAAEIAVGEMEVLRAKSCAFHMEGGGWFDDWATFLNRYGLGDSYRYDPWVTDYNWDTANERWRSAGPDKTLGTADDVLSAVLTDDACPAPAFHDPFDNLDYWDEVPPLTVSPLGFPIIIPEPGGSHGIASHDGDNAMTPTSTWGWAGLFWQRTLLLFDWAAAGLDPDQAWLEAGNYLSYEAQVKVDVETVSPQFMAGLSFRNLNADEYPGYGVSFLRPNGNNIYTLDIDPDFVPSGHDYELMLVLWERQSTADQNWIAYKVLPKYVEFIDSMDSYATGWTGDINSGDENYWRISSYQGHSAWQVHAERANATRILYSPVFDLSNANTAKLTYTHDRQNQWLFGARAQATVQVTDGSSWYDLATYTSQGTAEEVVFDLSDYTGSSNVQVRFIFEYFRPLFAQNTASWYIEDFSLTADMPVDMATLGFRIQEAAAVEYDHTENGTTAPKIGDIVLQQDGGGTELIRGVVVHDPVSGGDWAAGGASGTLLLNNISGTAVVFNPAYDLLDEAGNKIAEVDDYQSKTNFIKAFYGETTGDATGDADPFNVVRKPNPRPATALNWMPQEGDDYTADDDYFTLVQWDAVQGSASLTGYGNELNAIIRTDTHTTPISGTFADNEVGIHTWGSNYDIYFDDFGLRLLN